MFAAASAIVVAVDEVSRREREVREADRDRTAPDDQDVSRDRGEPRARGIEYGVGRAIF